MKNRLGTFLPTKNRFLILLQLALLLIFVIFLIYLGSLNAESEVYIDVEANKIGFEVSEMAEDLISNIPVDSIQIYNGDLKLTLGKVFRLATDTVISDSSTLFVFKDDVEVDSEFLLQNCNYLHLKKLGVSIFSKIILLNEGNAIRIDLEKSLDDEKNMSGVIGVGGEFLFSGRNVRLRGAGSDYSDYDVLVMHPHRFSKNFFFWANDKRFKLILYPPKRALQQFEIIRDVFVKNISFIEINQTRRKNREESTILNGKMQITSIDFTGKRFIQQEEILLEGDFLDVGDNDEYFINFIRFGDDGLKISMSCEKAKSLAKGKRIQLLRSIMPSKLDYIINEPSTKAIWSILCFLVAQITLAFKIYRDNFKIGGKKGDI